MNAERFMHPTPTQNVHFYYEKIAQKPKKNLLNLLINSTGN